MTGAASVLACTSLVELEEEVTAENDSAAIAVPARGMTKVSSKTNVTENIRIIEKKAAHRYGMLNIFFMSSVNVLILDCMNNPTFLIL